MNATVKKDLKRSSITENLIDDATTANKHKFSIFEILSNAFKKLI